MFLKNILKHKNAAVWGLGYLGYTMIYKLQNSGFNVIAYDLNQAQMRQFASGKYPDNNQKASWSLFGYVPKLDYSRVKLAKTTSEMFKNTYLHIIAIPENQRRSDLGTVSLQLAGIFTGHLKSSNNKPLIIFQSAFVPGNIERQFIARLKEGRILASKDYFVGGCFRNDWNVEAFINNKDTVPVAGFDQLSLQSIREFLSYLKIPNVALDSICDAEIYLNSVNAIQAMANDFIRQLSLGYPAVNIKKLAKSLFKHISLEDCELNIGTGGRRMTLAIDYLIEGSDKPENLTLLKEFQDINISSVLNYAEFLVQKNYRSVAILGISYKGNQKDLTLSPSVTLAEYLIKNSLRVFINDPFCSPQEIRHYVKNAQIIDFPKAAFLADVLVVATDHNHYKYLSQTDIDALAKKTKLIIDNYGIWSDLSFGKNIRYHQVGDGSLDYTR